MEAWGVQMRVLFGHHGCSGQVDLLSRPMFGPCFTMLKLWIRLPMGFFWHVLPVPSCIAVCLSGGVLAWDGLKHKGMIWREGFPLGACPSYCNLFLVKLYLVYFDFECMMVEKCCGCTCRCDFGLHLMIIKPVGDPLGFRMGLFGLATSDAVSLLGRWSQSLSWLGDPIPRLQV